MSSSMSSSSSQPLIDLTNPYNKDNENEEDNHSNKNINDNNNNNKSMTTVDIASNSTAATSLLSMFEPPPSSLNNPVVTIPSITSLAPTKTNVTKIATATASDLKHLNDDTNDNSNNDETSNIQSNRDTSGKNESIHSSNDNTKTITSATITNNTATLLNLFQPLPPSNEHHSQLNYNNNEIQQLLQRPPSPPPPKKTKNEQQQQQQQENLNIITPSHNHISKLPNTNRSSGTDDNFPRVKTNYNSIASSMRTKATSNNGYYNNNNPTITNLNHKKIGWMKENTMYSPQLSYRTPAAASKRNDDDNDGNDWWTAIVGSFTLVMFHIVYTLSQASAVSSTRMGGASLMGPLARMGAWGLMVNGPFIIWDMTNHHGIPSTYPCVDAFSVPFYGLLASILDETIPANTPNMEQVWISTFTTMIGIGMIVIALFNFLAAKFKLANLGAFLPYPVLCGFFTSIAIMVELLALSIDTNGLSIPHIIKSRKLFTIIHHAPSLFIGATMKIIATKYSPIFTPVIAMISIPCVYIVMILSGTSLSQAQQQGWFWTADQFTYTNADSSNNNDSLSLYPFKVETPPMGLVASLFIHENNVYLPAIRAGLPMIFTMATIYLVRCSLHAPALKKHTNILIDWKREQLQKKAEKRQQQETKINNKATFTSKYNTGSNKTHFHNKNEMVTTNNNVSNMQGNINVNNTRKRSYSSSVLQDDFYFIEIEEQLSSGEEDRDNNNIFSNNGSKEAETNSRKEQQLQPTATVSDILINYSKVHLILGIIGGFSCLPSIGIGGTMFKLGAEKTLPQYLSIVLLIIFYMTDFSLVSYIPKCTFSSLLVLAFFDLLRDWFMKSYKKTKDKQEWMVVPVIVICTFSIGIISAVALGVALSTFVFVGTFYRTGVVKFLANGLTLRSTIERGVFDDEYLDEHGDLIQVLVLQNYLFFGNASSCLNYITSMFEDDAVVSSSSKKSATSTLNFPLPPIPKYLILDVGFVTGLDTSAVDVLADIISICHSNDCFVYIAGISTEKRRILAAGGIIPTTKRNSMYNKLRYFPSIESALGKAEDLILNDKVQAEKKMESSIIKEDNENGFLNAIKQIDIQHDVNFAPGLRGFESYTTLIELPTGQSLYTSGGGLIDDNDRGLFFIERGLMRVERDSSQTLNRSLSRNSSNSIRQKEFMANGTMYATPKLNSSSSIGQLKARTETIGRGMAVLKKMASVRGGKEMHNFRLARVGPGWVVGCMEASAALRNPGKYTAVTDCRLHHLPYHKIEEIEDKNPILVLNLFKMMAHLTARRQEITIGQLATMYSIVTSTAPTKPIGRVQMGAIKNALRSIDNQ